MTKGKLILIGLIFLLIIAGAWSEIHCFPFSKCPWQRSQNSRTPKKVTLTFVGAWDEPKDWSTIISSFRQSEIQNRNLDVNVVYEQLDKYNYEDVLFDRQVNKKGPNIFMMFNTWLPKYQQRIVEMPSGMMTLDQFDKFFPQVAKDDLVSDGKIYSLPIYIDTLALFYNKDMLFNAGFIKPPETWNDFADYVEKLTVMGADKKITRMGAAIGGADSTNRSQDILMLMVMQNNLKAERRYSNNLVTFLTPEAQRAVKFYTDFADPTKKYYTWDYDDKTYSIDAFTQMRAAMSINYSYEIADIASKTGGTLNYGVAPVPQQYPNDKINYANYWSPVVAKDADCVREKGVTADCATLSWDFINFAAQADNAKSYVESTGRPAANLVLVQQQIGQDGSKLAPFAQQVLTARSWKDVSNSKNDQTLLDMIDSIITTDKSRKKNVVKAMTDTMNIIKELN